MANQFEHFIVLMLENRSFDHIFGYLGIGDGLYALPHGGGVNHLKPGSKRGHAYHSQRGGDYVAIGKYGPSHSLVQTNVQLFGTQTPSDAAQAADPPMDGFVASYANALQSDLRRKPIPSELQQIMNAFDPVQLPVLSTLAKSFVLCDRWFSDMPGPTLPNRSFVHAATSQGYTDNRGWKVNLDCATIYDRINAAAGVTWRVYYSDHDEIAELYPNVKIDPTCHAQFDVSYAPDVAGDKLATYSFIVPTFVGTPQQPTNSMHAPGDVRPAEKLVADVYSALQAAPDVWKKTLLIVVFDETGGYYDHVPPPQTVNPDGIPGKTDESFLVPFNFQRLGLRVPAILISPWFQPAVDSTVYSHSTIPGSLIEALGLGDYLTLRDKQANKLTKYIVQDDTRVWRTDVPTLTVPVQPQALDQMQREVLEATVHLDPHPKKRNRQRTDDIQDPAQARDFMRTQLAKNLEHRLAARGDPGRGARMSAENQPASITVSPARITELEQSA
jgi:phospholipase C